MDLIHGWLYSRTYIKPYYVQVLGQELGFQSSCSTCLHRVLYSSRLQVYKLWSLHRKMHIHVKVAIKMLEINGCGLLRFLYSVLVTGISKLTQSGKSRGMLPLSDFTNGFFLSHFFHLSFLPAFLGTHTISWHSFLVLKCLFSEPSFPGILLFCFLLVLSFLCCLPLITASTYLSCCWTLF